MDLGSILAVARQQRSIPGLLSMLRGGDVQGGGGGGGPVQGATSQAGGGGANTSQLQMAQSAMDGDGGRGGGPQGGQYENAWDNPANWGAPPPVTGPMSATQGFFPSMFQQGQDPNGKFWSMGDYMRQYQQKYGGQLPEVMDEQHNNTINSRMLANPGRPNEPGAFMVLGHHISPAKLQYDLHRPISDPATAGSIHFSRQFGPTQTAWSTTGELGLPGQLEPFATMWGAGGPGSG